MKRRLNLVLSKHCEDDDDMHDDSSSNENNNTTGHAVRASRRRGKVAAAAAPTTMGCIPDSPLAFQRPLPKQVIVVDRHHRPRQYCQQNGTKLLGDMYQPYDRELERQTHDFLIDRLLRGSVLFRDNLRPERTVPRFVQDDLLLGTKLGGGEFGKVYKIESFDQRTQNVDFMPGAIVMDASGGDSGSGGGGRNASSAKTDGNTKKDCVDQKEQRNAARLPEQVPQTLFPRIPKNPSSENRCHGKIDQVGYNIDSTTNESYNLNGDSSSSEGNPSTSFAVPFPQSQSSGIAIGSSQLQCGYYYSDEDMSDLDDDGEEEIDRARLVDERRRTMIRRCHRHGEPQYAIKVVRRELTGWKRYMATIDMACELKFLAALSHPNIIHIRGVMGYIGRPEHFGIIMDRLQCDLSEKIDGWKRETISRNQLRTQPSRGWHPGSSWSFGSVGTDEKRYRPVLSRFMRNRSRSRSSSPFSSLVGSGKVRDDDGSSDFEQQAKEWDDLLVDRLMACYDVARAMKYLHNKSVLFRDLKPDNVGLTLQGVYVLFDMGLTVELRQSDLVEPPDGYAITGLTGSRMFMAPENALCKPYGFASDTYSFAMLMWEVISLERAFQGWNLDKHFQCVIVGGERPPSLGDTLSPALDRMIQQAWNDDPLLRPTFTSICEIMKTEIVQRVDCNERNIVMDDRTEHLQSVPSGSSTPLHNSSAGKIHKEKERNSRRITRDPRQSAEAIGA